MVRKKADPHKLPQSETRQELTRKLVFSFTELRRLGLTYYQLTGDTRYEPNQRISVIPRGSLLVNDVNGNYTAIAIRSNPINQHNAPARYIYLRLTREPRTKNLSIYIPNITSREHLSIVGVMEQIVQQEEEDGSELTGDIRRFTRATNETILRSRRLDTFLDHPTEDVMDALEEVHNSSQAEIDALEQEEAELTAEARKRAEADQANPDKEGEAARKRAEEEATGDTKKRERGDPGDNSERISKWRATDDEEFRARKRERGDTEDTVDEPPPTRVRQLAPGENVIPDMDTESAEVAAPEGANVLEHEQVNLDDQLEQVIAEEVERDHGEQLPEGTRVHTASGTADEVGPSQVRALQDGRSAVPTGGEGAKMQIAGELPGDTSVPLVPDTDDTDLATTDEDPREEESKEQQVAQFQADQQETLHERFGNTEIIPDTHNDRLGSSIDNLPQNVVDTATPQGREGTAGAQTIAEFIGLENPGLNGYQRQGDGRGDAVTNDLGNAPIVTDVGTSANAEEAVEELVQQMNAAAGGGGDPDDPGDDDDDDGQGDDDPDDRRPPEDNNDGEPQSGAFDFDDDEQSAPDRILEVLNGLIRNGRLRVDNAELVQSVQALTNEVDLLRGETHQSLRQLFEELQARREDAEFVDAVNPDDPVPPDPINLVEIVNGIRNDIQQLTVTAAMQQNATNDLVEGIQAQTDRIAREQRRSRRELQQMQELIAVRQDQWDRERAFEVMRQNEAMNRIVRMSERGTYQQRVRVRGDVAQEEEQDGMFMFWLLRYFATNLVVPLTTHSLALMFSAVAPMATWTTNRIWWAIAGGVDPANLNFEGVDIEDGQYDDAAVIRRAVQQAGPQPVVEFPPRDAPLNLPNTYVGGDGLTDFQRSIDRAGQGRPSAEFNLPDPRYSERGGQLVPNTFERQIKNPKYDPRLKPGDKGYQPPFITQTNPDVGLGAKDNVREQEKREADRLLQNLPVKLYAPIHAQAVDRYLGRINYGRLGVDLPDYIRTYTDLQLNANDTTSLFRWNVMTMIAYGPMLYAFVNDESMQRNLPAYALEDRRGVEREFMELYELLKELQEYYKAAPSRADRVADTAGASSQGQPTLTQQLEQYERQRSMKFAEQGFGPGAVVIQTDAAGNAPPADDDDPGDDPADRPDPPPLPDPPAFQQPPTAAPIPTNARAATRKREAARALTSNELEYGIARKIQRPAYDPTRRKYQPAPPASRRDTGNGRPYTGKEYAGDQGVSPDERLRLFRALGGRL